MINAPAPPQRQISPDGQFEWDGQTWLPRQPAIAPPPPTGKKKGFPVKRVIAGVVVLLVMGTCVSLSASNTGSKSTAKATPAATAPAKATSAPVAVAPLVAPTSAPKAKFLTFHDGSQRVGTDIQPGTYRTRFASPGCYWSRLSGFGGTLGEILANENTSGPAVVTIAATDKGFDSSNCATWTSDLSQATKSTTSFTDGTYIVGTDIAPGTYRNSGGQCYWARLSGFGGSLNEVLANGNATAPAVVTILASDRGFTASSCGTWSAG